MNKQEDSLRKLNGAWLQGRFSAASGYPVLICDDSETDIFFLLRAITASKVRNPIFAVRSGRELLRYLEGSLPFNDRSQYPIPSIVFLDLRMNQPDGFEILRWKQKRPELARTIFVAMSNFDSTLSINNAYACGATTFLSKPLNGADVKNIIYGFEDRWDLKAGATATTRD